MGTDLTQPSVFFYVKTEQPATIYRDTLKIQNGSTKSFSQNYKATTKEKSKVPISLSPQQLIRIEQTKAGEKYTDITLFNHTKYDIDFTYVGRDDDGNVMPTRYIKVLPDHKSIRIKATRDSAFGAIEGSDRISFDPKISIPISGIPPKPPEKPKIDPPQIKPKDDESICFIIKIPGKHIIHLDNGNVIKISAREDGNPAETMRCLSKSQSIRLSSDNIITEGHLFNKNSFPINVSFIENGKKTGSFILRSPSSRLYYLHRIKVTPNTEIFVSKIDSSEENKPKESLPNPDPYTASICFDTHANIPAQLSTSSGKKIEFDEGTSEFKPICMQASETMSFEISAGEKELALQIFNKNNSIELNVKITSKASSSSRTVSIAPRKRKTIRLYLGDEISVTSSKRVKPSDKPTLPSDSFTLQLYGEQGIELFKNDMPYHSFTNPTLSGVKISLKDNDYIDIGQESFDPDPRTGKASQFTEDNQNKRSKKRRLIVENTTHHLIIIRAQNTLNAENIRTYTITNGSESHLFFGKEKSRLYILFGKRIENTLPLNPHNKIVLYYAFHNLPDDNNITVNLKHKNTATPVSPDNGRFLSELENKDTIDITLSKQSNIQMVVASDARNSNIMLQIKGDKNGYVIRPGGVTCIDLKQNSTETEIKVFNTLLKWITVYEMEKFTIPFEIEPIIRRKMRIEVDVLNSSLFELQAEILKARKEIHGFIPKNCELLNQMLYSNFSLEPDLKNNKPNLATALTILFSGDEGIARILITIRALINKYQKNNTHKESVSKLINLLTSTITKTDYYKDKVINLMTKDAATFPFEYNLSDEGIITCMYSQINSTENFLKNSANWLWKE